MCRQCHNSLSDSQVLSQMKEAETDPHFEEWNTSSVSHVLIAASGHNGTEAADIANKILDDFEIYLKTKPYKYLPKNGVESMVSVNELKKLRNNEENWKDPALNCAIC